MNDNGRDSANPDTGTTEESPAPHQDDAALDNGAQTLFIVGIGASAGGLEALSALLKQVQLDSMAFVVVQHLAPKHESFLPALLARASNIAVVPAEDGAKVENNHVYVIPPNANLAILQGVLHLMPPEDGSHGPRLPIDYFFRSLAEDQGPRSIGIILSGTGSDGTFGFKAIKERGGITFAQDPQTARYEGMPRSALDSGWADFCLAPEAIAEELQKISRHPYLTRARGSSPQVQENVAKLILLMRGAFGNDLTYYKPTTLDRRIERRMALHKIEKVPDYVKYVQSNADELRLLYEDMLIGVTSFFRDVEPFEVLKNKVFPKLVGGKELGAPIRIWAPACSTGEEAYSIAICLLEFLGDRAADFRIQVFGTDVDEKSIPHARRGVYPQNIALDVSPERLQRFFIKKDGEYQVSRRVRDMVVFSTHNVTKDAPFSRLDLVSCRNLLIYLRPTMQKKVLRFLHYSLLPTGFLMLGTSETVGDATDLFTMVDRKCKIYTRRNVAAVAMDFGFGVQGPDTAAPSPTAGGQRGSLNVAQLAERKILEYYGPPGVLVNDDLDVVHIRGRTRGYLEHTPGAPSFNVLRLARPELHVDLRRAIHEAKSNGTRTRVASRLTDEGKTRSVELEVLPVIDPETKIRCWLVLFHERDGKQEGREAEQGDEAKQDGADGASLPTREATGVQEERQRELERELMVTKEYLQSTIEELESSNEELKSSNEELQSSNEELQSTNEELETSKEELQSANEELTTVNDELQNRMGELQQINDDLHNVLSGVDEAVVIVGLDLRIRRYTTTAEKLMNLVAGDVGRTVNHLHGFVTGERLDELASEVIEHLQPIEKRIRAANQRWYDLRIRPYKTLDHAIKGAVIVLVEAGAAPDDAGGGG